MISAWLNYTKAIYQPNNKTSLDFNFTGGLDPYITSNRKGSWYPFLIDNEMSEWLGPTEMNGNYKNTYTFFLLPQIKSREVLLLGW